MLSLILIVPGVIVAYALFIRALLHKVPALQKFYAEADGFWSHVWAVCGKSLTMAWGYIVGGIGSFFALVDKIGPMLGDPNLDIETKVKTTLTDHPAVAGYVLIGISVITILSRMRTIGKTS